MASAEFDAAVAAVGTLRKDPGNETKPAPLRPWQAGHRRRCHRQAPGMMDFVGRAKYDAWAAPRAPRWRTPRPSTSRRSTRWSPPADPSRRPLGESRRQARQQPGRSRPESRRRSSTGDPCQGALEEKTVESISFHEAGDRAVLCSRIESGSLSPALRSCDPGSGEEVPGRPRWARRRTRSKHIPVGWTSRMRRDDGRAVVLDRVEQAAPPAALDRGRRTRSSASTSAARSRAFTSRAPSATLRS